MNKIQLQKISLICFLALLTLVGCSSSKKNANLTPTLNVTQAYQTVEARMTQAASITPLAPDTETPLPPPTVEITPSTVITTSAVFSNTKPVTAAPAGNCTNIASPGNPIDVTIPDLTTMNPGQAFTKTWRLINSGTCTWTNAYKLMLLSGEAMSGNAIPLPANIPPNQSIDLSVNLVAPLNAGVYTGNWMLQTPNGKWFGTGADGGSYFWVQITVNASATGTPTTAPATNTPLPIPPTAIPPTAPPAPTLAPENPTAAPAQVGAQPTAAPTVSSGAGGDAVVQTSGAALLKAGDKFDVDTGKTNPVIGGDLTYEQNPQNKHFLKPEGSVALSVVGAQQPNFSTCKAATFSAKALTMEDIPPGSYVCVRTDLGSLGWLDLSGINPSDFSLTFAYQTWVTP